jgi:plastocyanin
VRLVKCSIEGLWVSFRQPEDVGFRIYNLSGDEDMKKNGLLTVLMISVMLLGVSYGLSAAADEGDSTVIVTIDGSAFNPEVAVVKVGGEVVWKNKDAAPHTITADDGSFDSGTLQQGGEYRKKFTSPGTIRYSCDIHAYMSGRIEVR